jgi:CO/xanthine dehydrogenase Mo-binding subunit/aerobic-type carbon monoxide dehydrogenase small subunit (CoxS/CutS family)
MTSPPVNAGAAARGAEKPLHTAPLEFTVNGECVSLEVHPADTLSTVLREKLRLTGTKIACEEAECGSCTVLLDGQPVLSCTVPALKAHGKQVLTIEGIGEDDRLHPLQEAFIESGATQCGFCTPGQIMTAYALLQENPVPSDEEIRHALKDTLCRCGCYPAILRAIQMAAGREAAPPANPAQVSSARRVIGTRVPRPDARLKVTGQALFADDYTFPGMLHARVLRAGVPHGVLLRLDVDRARRAEGVAAVLMAEDVPGEPNHGVVSLDWPVLVAVGETARYVGDALAIVAAETHEQAARALELIEFEFEALPVVSDPVQAHEPGAQPVHRDGNLLEEINVAKGDLAEGFRQAEVTFASTYRTPMMDHLFMEPECSLAHTGDDGRIEVLVGSQIPYADRDQIARCLGLKPEEVRVRGVLVGGGFGGKEDIAGQIHAALLTQATGRPVKLLYDRHESLIAHPKRHGTQIEVRLGAKRDGTLTAAQTTLYGDTGAYASLGEHVMTRATTHSTGPYLVPHVRADCYAMFTNNPPAGAFRGFGALQAAFAIESAMDELAVELGLNPIELRRINALREGSITNTGQRLENSVGLMECIDKVEEALLRVTQGRDPFTPAEVEGSPHLRRAWGFAVAFKNTGLGGGAPDKAEAEVEIFPNGRIQARISSAEIGQGLVTVLQMVAAQEFSAPVESVEVLLSDTDLTPDGGPTTGSRQTYVSGNAVRLASATLREAMTATLAEKFDLPPEEIRYVGGLAQVGQRRVPLGEAAVMMKEEGREPRASYEYWAPETQPLGTGGNMHFDFSFAAQAAEVEVNLHTGEVGVLRVISATDVGTAINPLGLAGQIEGGIIMGIGHTLTEEFILQNGQVFTDRMARYRMPSIMHSPEITFFTVEHPTTEGPYGAKGVGEITTMPTIPAITNAVYFATGIRVRKIPVDQEALALQLAARPD